MGDNLAFNNNISGFIELLHIIKTDTTFYEVLSQLKHMVVLDSEDIETLENIGLLLADKTAS